MGRSLASTSPKFGIEKGEVGQKEEADCLESKGTGVRDVQLSFVFALPEVLL